MNLGTLELSDGQIEKARKNLERAAALDPQANWQLSDLYVETGERDRARVALRKAVEAGEPRSLLDIASLEWEAGHPREAYRALQEAIEQHVEGAQELLAAYFPSSDEHEPPG